MNNKTFNSGNFRLEKNKLYYKNKLYLSNCDDIINLTLELGLGNFDMLEQLDIDESEIHYLEQMLTKAIYTQNICLKK